MANGTFKSGVPAVGFPVFVDVRDVALAHVRAVELDAAKGQRYLLIGGTYVSDSVDLYLTRQLMQMPQRLDLHPLETRALRRRHGAHSPGAEG